MTRAPLPLAAAALLHLAAPAAADEKAVRAVLDAQVAAWNRADLDGFMAGYWEDDRLTFVSGGDVHRGWKATKERYEKRYLAGGKDRMGRLAFRDLTVDVLGPDAAAVLGEFVLERDGAVDRGRFTLVVRRFPGGWKVVHDHTSVNCPPPAKK